MSYILYLWEVQIYLSLVLVYVAYVLIGLGSFVTNLCNLHSPNPREFLKSTLILSLPILVALLYLYNIFLPINLYTNIFFLVIATVGLFIANQRGKLLTQFKFGPKQLTQIALTVFVIAFIAVLYSSLLWGDSFTYDDHFYHRYSIRLINDYPAITGISNLYGRLAQTEGSFYLAAFLNFYPVLPRTMLTPVAFNVLVFILLFYSYTVLFQKNSATSPLKILIFIMLFALPHFCGSFGIWGVSDLSVLIIEALIVLLLLEHWHSENMHLPMQIIFASCFMVFIKLSSIVFFFVVVLALFLIQSEKSQGLKKIRATWYKEIAFLFLSCFIFALPYFAQNIIKSGLLLYPIAFTNLHLAWSNPIVAQWSSDIVTGWARYPTSSWPLSLHSWLWIPGWLNYFGHSFFYMGLTLLPALAICVTSFIIQGRRGQKANSKTFFVIAFLWLMLFAYWFIMMPSTRFSGILFMIPSLLLYYFALKNFGIAQLGSELENMWLKHSTAQIQARMKLYSALLIIAVLSTVTLPSIPAGWDFTSKLEQKTNASGVTVYVPIDDERIGDSPLFPATPYFSEALRYRDPQHPSKGFYCAPLKTEPLWNDCGREANPNNMWDKLHQPK